MAGPFDGKDKAPTPPGGTFTLETLKANRRSFDVYNEKKLAMLRESVESPAIIDLLESVPFLLSVNSPDVPGYQDFEGMPLGVRGHVPSERARSFIRARFPSANPAPPAGGKPFVQMLALMGSAGTVAYTSESDFDFWICCHESDVAAEELLAFKAKCRAIEAWALGSFNVEVHFYINDIGKVRRNVFDDDGDGYFGAANGELLKEEFLRSSIVLAGAVPLWWVVPDTAGCTEAYGRLSLLADQGKLGADYICLGNICAIRREDFLVGALFQILKSLDSPFKAIVKMGLLQRYLQLENETPFICSLIKRNIHAGRFDTEDIDAYIIMFNQVHEFFAFQKKDRSAANILRAAFYLKVEPRLSEAGDGGGEKARFMRTLVRRWNWPEETVKMMDSFRQWGIEPVNKLLNGARRFILGNYRELLAMVERGDLRLSLTEDDLRGMTRKIQSHFAISEDKIDTATGFKNYPPERALSVEYVRAREGGDFWILSRRANLGERLEKIIIHKQSSLFGVIAFICVNGLYLKGHTRLDISAGIHASDPNFLRELIPALTLHFRHGNIAISASHYLRDPFPVVSFLVINPFSRYAQKPEDMVFMYHNSWGETRFETHRGEGDLPGILARVLTGVLQTGRDFESSLKMMASPPWSSTKEHRNLAALLSDLHAFFLGAGPAVKSRYVTVLGNRHAVFSTTGSGADFRVAVTVFESEAQMLYSISSNDGRVNRLRADPSVKGLRYLSEILRHRREGAVDIYCHRESKYAYYFVADERGGLCFFRKKSAMYIEYLRRLKSYALSAAEQVGGSETGASLAGRDDAVTVHALFREGDSAEIRDADPRLLEALESGSTQAVPFILSIYREDGQVKYAFSLPDGDRSEIFARSDIPDIAGDLTAVMAAVKGYLYYASAVELRNASPGDREGTSFAFAEKNRFELLVEKALDDAAKRGGQSR